MNFFNKELMKHFNEALMKRLNEYLDYSLIEQWCGEENSWYTNKKKLFLFADSIVVRRRKELVQKSQIQAVPGFHSAVNPCRYINILTHLHTPIYLHTHTHIIYVWCMKETYMCISVCRHISICSTLHTYQNSPKRKVAEGIKGLVSKKKEKEKEKEEEVSEHPRTSRALCLATFFFLILKSQRPSTLTI